MSIEIITLPSGVYKTNTYYVFSGKHACIIDPAAGCEEKIEETVEKTGCEEFLILVTHSHWDHIGAVQALKERLQASCYVHEEDGLNLLDPGSDGIPGMITVEVVEEVETLSDGDSIEFGKVHFRVIHTPGHTKGSICFYMKEEGALFSGDTIFKGGPGAQFSSSPPKEVLEETLCKLSFLPEKTRIYPGHGPSTVLEREEWLLRYQHGRASW